MFSINFLFQLLDNGLKTYIPYLRQNINRKQCLLGYPLPSNFFLKNKFNFNSLLTTKQKVIKTANFQSISLHRMGLQILVPSPKTTCQISKSDIQMGTKLNIMIQTHTVTYLYHPNTTYIVSRICHQEFSLLR